MMPTIPGLHGAGDQILACVMGGKSKSNISRCTVASVFGSL